MASPAVASSSSSSPASSSVTLRKPEEDKNKSSMDTIIAAVSGDSQRPSQQAHEEEEGEEEEEEDDDEEPKLKYSRLTKSLGGVYRNGDAVSCFWVGADKMILGTHNGNIHILSLPSLHPLRTYHAHSASITCISVSPPPPPTPAAANPSLNHSSHTSTNIFIGTSSIDGHVCITPLSALLPRNLSQTTGPNTRVQPQASTKEILMKNFSRPLLSIALSPNYAADKTYLSGGLSTNLVLSQNDKPGTKLTSSTVSGSAVGGGWGLGMIPWTGGDGGGKDVILSSGEGPISSVNWSKESPRYVTWSCESGVKIMRSNGFLSGEKERLVKEGGVGSSGRAEWRRICAIERPESISEEMAGVVKPKIEWVDRRELAKEEEEEKSSVITESEKGGWDGGKEVLVIGWGSTVWVVNVHSGEGATEEGRMWGWGEIAHILRTDCTVSGIALYSQSQLLLLAHLEDAPSEPEAKVSSPAGSPRPRGGISSTNRRKAQSPELRLISLTTSDEICADSLMMSRYESLSASDYHLGVLPVVTPELIPPSTATEGGLYGFGYGTDYILGAGATLWNAGVTATTIFSSAASVRSFGSGGKADGERSPTLYSVAGSIGGSLPRSFSFWGNSGKGAVAQPTQATNEWMDAKGRKIYIASPFDVAFATERGLKDRLNWLLERQRYEEAWKVVDEHPEAVGNPTSFEESTAAERGSISDSERRLSQQLRDEDALTEEGTEGTSTPSTVGPLVPRTRQPQLMNPYLAAAAKEKRRIGELWLARLIKSNSWGEAGRVAGQVLDTSSRWEHWVWVFEAAGKIPEITPYLPNYVLYPPLPSIIYEIVLAHHLTYDRETFEGLILDTWAPELGLYDVNSIIDAVKQKVRAEEEELERLDLQIKEEKRLRVQQLARSRRSLEKDKEKEDDSLQIHLREKNLKQKSFDSLILCLAKLYMASKQPAEALHCYLRLKMFREVMVLIREYHVLDAVKDHIAELLMLKVTPELLEKGSMDDLLDATSEAIDLLVDEAGHGIVGPERVVSQLDEVVNGGRIIMFLYLRRLWTIHPSIADESYADLAIELWADYDRPLLMEFLKTSTSYSLEKASQVCEVRNYIPELVHLLSKTGQVKRALFLIIDRLHDVSQAIAFAKSQDDPELWEDLIGYSMDKPEFIKGLLENVGTAIDPIKLVRRIPEGMVVRGLKEALLKILKEYGVQFSVCDGVAKVLRSEVARKMEELKRGQRRAVKFEVPSPPPSQSSHSKDRDELQPPTAATAADETEVDTDEKRKEQKRMAKRIKPGLCATCHLPFNFTAKGRVDTLMAFPCSHIFHLSCLLKGKGKGKGKDKGKGPDGDGGEMKASEDEEEQGLPQPFISSFGGYSGGRSVGAKVTHAALIRERIMADSAEREAVCLVCRKKRREEDGIEGGEEEEEDGQEEREEE